MDYIVLMNKANILNKFHYKNKRFPKHTFYCGRGSPLGNKTPIDEINDRDKVCEIYKEGAFDKYENRSFDEKETNQYLDMLEQLMETDIYLLCYCYPRRCHCETIREILYKFRDNLLKLKKE